MDVLANIDPTSSNSAAADPFRPSFFELIAQEQLSQLLKPAIRYVLTVLAQRHPRYLLRIVNRFDEIYSLLMLAVERHYLSTWNASFTEHFYGLRRRRRPAVSTKRVEASVPPQKLQAARQLRPRDIYVSLAFLVGLPYVHAKLLEYWESVGGGVLTEGDDLFGDEPRGAQRTHRDMTAEQARRIKWEERFRFYYPYAQVVLQLWMLGYNISYLFGRTPYWRPWLKYMRVDVRRAMGNEKPLQAGAATQRLPSFTSFPFLFTYLLMRKGTSKLLDALKYALPASIFFFKFLEWWYSPSNRRRRGGDGGTETTKRISPPAVLTPSPQGVLYQPPSSYQAPNVLAEAQVDLPVDDMFADATTPATLLHNACPLCGAAPIQNACVLTTGYAFCYTCANAYVDKWHRCPVTLAPLPAGIEHIRRVLV